MEILAATDARLEHGRALQELGALLRRSNQRADARKPQKAISVAAACGASALLARTETELAALGARRRNDLLTGVDALTPSERRVADMAARGCRTPRSRRRCS